MERATPGEWVRRPRKDAGGETLDLERSVALDTSTGSCGGPARDPSTPGRRVRSGRNGPDRPRPPPLGSGWCISGRSGTTSGSAERTARRRGTVRQARGGTGTISRRGARSVSITHEDPVRTEPLSSSCTDRIFRGRVRSSRLEFRWELPCAGLRNPSEEVEASWGVRIPGRQALARRAPPLTYWMGRGAVTALQAALRVIRDTLETPDRQSSGSGRDRERDGAPRPGW